MEKNNIFNENCTAFCRAYHAEGVRYKKLVSKLDDTRVEVVERYPEGISYRVCGENGRKLMINRVFGEEDHVRETIGSYGTIMPCTPILVVGATQLEYIRKIVEVTDEKSVVIMYEPSLEVFHSVMCHEDIRDLILDSPVIFIIEGLYEDNLRDHFKNLFHIETLGSLKIEIAPNYGILFKEELKTAIQTMKKAHEDVQVTWATQKRYNKVRGKNLTLNLKHIVDGYNISQLRGILKKEVPAIVVSAGPSLNKNIDELKNAQGRACIIAVDTAIKPLLNHGIVPDFFCIVDGLKPTELMNHERVSEIPLVTCMVVADGIMDLHKGKKFFYYSDEEFENMVFATAKKEAGNKENLTPTGLPTGGSVANTAFSLAAFMEAKEIILVGQDLALTNGRTHADGTFKEKMDKLDFDKMRGLIEVEGIHGNTVYTRPDFHRYLRWFEEYIAINQMNNVIDATQGGAKIHGTKIMSLRKAIQKYCVNEVDIQSKVNTLPKMMDYGAKAGVAEYYRSLPNRMMKVHKKAKKGISLYKKFERIVESDPVDEEALLKISKEIGKLNDYMNNDSDALYIQGVMDDVNYLMKTSIFQSEEDELEERISIAKQGMVMCYGIALEALWWSKAFEVANKERPIKVGKEDIQGPIDELIYYIRNKEEVKHE